MSDVFEVYFHFDTEHSVDETVHLVQARSDINGVEIDIEPIEQRPLAETDVSIPFQYESVESMLNLTRHPSGLPDLPCLLLHFESLSFNPDLHGHTTVNARLVDTFELVTTIYSTAVAAGCQPQYVIGADPTHTEQLRTNHRFIETSKQGVLSETLETLYWLQIFPPAFADEIGRDVLRAASAHCVETLDDGAVLLVAYADPLYRDESYLNVLEHFGLEFPR